MLHITPELGQHADLVLDNAQRLTARARLKFDPDHPQQIYEFEGGSVLIVHGEPKRGRGGRFGMEGPVDAAVIDEVEALLKSHDLPGRFVLHPLADKTLSNELGSRGYCVENWMQVLLRQLDGSVALPDLPPEITIERISENQADLWADTTCEGFKTLGYPYLIDPSFHLPMAYADEGICYLARVDGAIAGAASLIMSDGWGVLFTSSTIPEFRSRGIQNFFIRQRLADARAANCTHAMILTDFGSGSQRNAERQGFQVAYTMLTMERDLG
jgi:Acetyltransferase (GNAT) family